MNSCLNPCGEPQLAGRALLRVSRRILHLRDDVLIERGRQAPRCLYMIIWTLQSSESKLDIFFPPVILWVIRFLWASRRIGTLREFLLTKINLTKARRGKRNVPKKRGFIFKYKDANYLKKRYCIHFSPLSFNI